MFTFLNPFGLWLGAALAVPLMIHFLGRQRLRKQPFPSLLLVQERFSKSMHRHRLKNLLLLIIRTLLILCLLLALSNPVMESRKASVRPDISVALIHNGIYGSLRPGEAIKGAGKGAGKEAAETGAGLSATAGNRERAYSGTLDAQWKRIRDLDSSQGGKTLAVPAIADGPGAQEVSQRFGDYQEAVRRALTALGAQPGTAQLLLPVFDWTEASAVQSDLDRALKESPGLHVLLVDHVGAAAGLNAFSGLKARPSPDSPTLRVEARLSPAAAETGGKAQVILNGRPFQEVNVEGGRAEVTLPLGSGPRTVGRVSLPGGGFAAPDLHFCFPDAGEWSLAHAGSAMASLPSLGRETYFRRIIHVAASRDIPWDGPSDGGARTGSGGLRMVYLAAERASQPDVYARAVEYVKRGGRLIIGVGRDSDIPGLNRFLLQPLRLGRLGNLQDIPAATPVNADRQALSRLGRLPADAGSLGAVRKRFAFAPDSGAETLLYQGSPPEAVLAARDFHRGHVLLWTTDIDDLEWSDIGVRPLIPLLHQAFQEEASGDRAANLAVASDSLYTFAVDPGAGSRGAVSDGTGAGPSVLDPEGRAFTKVRADGSRLRIGPFDKLGIHLIVTGKDTSAFAVNLAQREAFSDSAAKAAPGEAQSAFLNAFKPYRGRVTVLSPDEPAAVQASVRKLWPAFLLTALLLLFLEGLISSTFSLRRNKP